MAPVGTLHIAPPLEVIVQFHGMIGGCEYDRPRYEILRRRAGEVFRARRSLGKRHILGRLYELRESVVRDFGLVHPESIHSDTMPRLGIRKLVCAHPEFAAGNPDHAPRCRNGWRRWTPGYWRYVYWLG